MQLWFLLDPNPQQQQQFQGGYPPNQQQAYYPPNQQQPQAYYPPAQTHQNPYNPPQQPLNMQHADPEDPEAKGFEFNDQSIRKGFIRKVFSILTVSNEKKLIT